MSKAKRSEWWMQRVKRSMHDAMNRMQWSDQRLAMVIASDCGAVAIIAFEPEPYEGIGLRTAAVIVAQI